MYGDYAQVGWPESTMQCSAIPRLPLEDTSRKNLLSERRILADRYDTMLTYQCALSIHRAPHIIVGLSSSPLPPPPPPPHVSVLTIPYYISYIPDTAGNTHAKATIWIPTDTHAGARADQSRWR